MNYQSRFIANKQLKELSTFGIGGLAKYFIETSSIKEMQSILAYCSSRQLDFIVIGKGSNCLFDDRGFDGLVVLNKISFCEYDGPEVFVGAGFNFSLLGVQSAKRGLSGLEFACGIPATVGGAVYMNAGASGQETSTCLKEVHFLDEHGHLHIFQKNELEFSYRKSFFQKKKGAIVAAKFLLAHFNEARTKQRKIIEYRTKTQPYGEMSIGCIFRNPDGPSAGALIQQCGLKGASIGAAEVSLLHANFIINKNDARAIDVLDLAKKVQDKVFNDTGIELEMEIQCIPYSNKT